MIRDYRHVARDYLRLWTCYRRWSESMHVHACIGDGHILGIYYRSCWILRTWIYVTWDWQRSLLLEPLYKSTIPYLCPLKWPVLHLIFPILDFLNFIYPVSIFFYWRFPCKRLKTITGTMIGCCWSITEAGGSLQCRLYVLQTSKLEW